MGQGGARTPLNPIHLSPTSLINSAVSTDCFLSFDPPVARLYSSVNPSGEFIVIVAAVYSRETNSSAYIKAQLTDKVSHAGTPTFFAEASFLKPSYTDRIRGGAGSVFGLANGALMSAFRLDDSFDILALLNISLKQIENPPGRPSHVFLQRVCEMLNMSWGESAIKQVPTGTPEWVLALTVQGVYNWNYWRSGCTLPSGNITLTGKIYKRPQLSPGCFPSFSLPTR